MYRFISVVFIFSILSCANKSVSDINLYNYYIALSKSSESGEIVNNRKMYYSSAYLSEVDVSDKKSLFLLKFPKYVNSVDTYYQKINGNIGCLTINGFDKEKSPVFLFVEYIKENSRWYVNYMYLNFVENKSEFVGRAVCPKEIEAKKA